MSAPPVPHPIADALPAFKDRYRAKLGIPGIEVNWRRYGFDVSVGYNPFKGLYMNEGQIFIPFWGQSAGELIDAVKAEKRKLEVLP